MGPEGPIPLYLFLGSIRVVGDKPRQMVQSFAV